MPSKYIHTELEGQKLKLSNLDKVIYPDSNITKAEIIQYYIDVSALFLKYSRNRPTTLIRYPDGIDKSSFYAKSAPEWTPDWIRTILIEHSQDSINYIVPENKAAVAWLANLSALELHPTQMQFDQLENPDHFIFDLDPDPNQSFEDIKSIAFLLNEFLKIKGYHPFVKTSGSKGLHIYVPIVSNVTHEQMVDEVKKLAQEFVGNHSESCTLHLQKQKRNGKLLIDIYRNHKTQTTVAPYSLRAKANAPISMPLTWNSLETIDSSKYFHIRNFKAYLEELGDPWESYESSRVIINSKKVKAIPVADEVVPDQLSVYDEKRNFEGTSEPHPQLDSSDQSRFVIQIHNASNLHYDLRLEKEGVLLSWAIPKGIPTMEGEKRMAIQTEPHPVKYLDFEGVIPKGAYGAGKMWVFDTGRYESEKFSNKSISFKLSGKKINACFSMYKTRDDQWLLERKSGFVDAKEKKISHMLAGAIDKIPNASDQSYEIKWDGIRVFLIKNGGHLKILSRSGRDITDSFPEIIEAGQEYIKHYRGIFDGELVSLDEQGKPIFSEIISRMHLKGEQSILRASKVKPSVLYLFDLTELDGIDLTNEALEKRQEWLGIGLKTSKRIRISEVMSDGKALLAAAEKLGLEGIMIKDKKSSYSYGSRTKSWLKLKFRQTATCYIIGYTEGKGDRSNLFGSLHLVEKQGDEIIYRGRVGSGFDGKKMKFLLEKLEPLIIDKKPIPVAVDEERYTTWVKSEFLCEVQYASLTSNKTFREPIFMHLREDLSSQ